MTSDIESMENFKEYLSIIEQIAAIRYDGNIFMVSPLDIDEDFNIDKKYLKQLTQMEIVDGTYIDWLEANLLTPYNNSEIEELDLNTTEDEVISTEIVDEIDIR